MRADLSARRGLSLVSVSVAVLVAAAAPPTAAEETAVGSTAVGSTAVGSPEVASPEAADTADAAAADGLIPADWPGYRNRPGSGGLSRGEQALSPATVGGLRLRRTVPVADPPGGLAGGQVGGTGHGLLYRGGATGGLEAHDMGTGALVWSRAEGSNQLSVGRSAVYTIIPEVGVAAYRADTGALLWRRMFTGLQDAAPPTLVGGQLLVGLSRSTVDENQILRYDAEVVSLSTATGAVQWRSPVTGAYGFVSHVAVWGSTAVVQGDGDTVDALDLATGARRWNVRGEGSQGFGASNPSPVVREAAVYIGLANGVFRALDRVTGRTLWTFDRRGAFPLAGARGPQSSWSSAAEGDGMVYVAASLVYSDEPDLFALEAATGAVRWSARAGGSYSSESAPTLANGVLYTGSYDDRRGSSLKAYNASTGALLGSWAAGSDTEPMVSGGKVWVADSRRLYEFSR